MRFAAVGAAHDLAAEQPARAPLDHQLHGRRLGCPGSSAPGSVGVRGGDVLEPGGVASRSLSPVRAISQSPTRVMAVPITPGKAA